jgi:prolipoprotein diacylglyceryltransferase
LTVLATLIGARLGHVFFYDWEYYRNHLSEIILPFRFTPNFEFTGYQGLASHELLFLLLLPCILQQNVLRRPQLWILDRVVIPVASGHFCTIREFFNSEIIGYETQSTFGIKFIRDHFSAMDAVNATQIANPKDAYN